MIYVVLPVHNRKEITRRFVRCLREQTVADYHLLLVDDGCDDGTAQMVEGEISSLTVLRGKGDWWWGGSLHQAYRWLANQRVDPADVVLIMNDDTVFEPDFLERGVNSLRESPRSIVCAEWRNPETGKLRSGGVHFDWRRLAISATEAPEKINCAPTRGLFLRALDFLEIGDFHPLLLPHYLSDLEFTFRAARKGYRILCDGSVRFVGNKETCGYLPTGREPYRVFLRKYFSKKSVSHPPSWLAFAALASPWPYKLLNSMRVVKRTGEKLVHELLSAR